MAELEAAKVSTKDGEERAKDTAEEIVQAIRAGDISGWETHELNSCEYLKQLHKWEEASKADKAVKGHSAGPRKWPYDNEYQTLAAMGCNSESPTIEKMHKVLKEGLIEAADPGELSIPAEYCDDSPPLQENVVLATIEPADWLKQAIAESIKNAPHPVFCACDVCMDGPRKMEFKNTWGLPAIEVFNEAGEKRAEEICGIKLADVSEEVKIENLLKGAPVTVNFVGSGIREKGYSLPGYQTLGVVSSVNTFDTLATLPPMSEDELVDALYTNEDMHSRAKGELAIKKARRKALAESEAEITFSIRDLQQCESFLELKRKYILPALHKQAESCTLEWIRAHDSYYQHLMDVDRTETLKEDAAEKETS
jgi:hypothetical protein